MPMMVCTEYILTMVMAIARGVGRSTDGNVVEISTIHAGYILLILNVIKCQYILIICQGDAVGVGGSYELMLHVKGR